MGFFRYMDLNGDGTGSKDMAVNGSITEQVFKLAPRSGERFLLLERAIIHYSDAGTFDSGSYGNGITLANGIEVGIYNEDGDTLRTDLLDGLPIKTNPDWGRSCFDTTVSSYGVGNETATVRWTFSKTGSPLRIGTDAYLALKVRDDLTGLVEHYVQIQGVAEQ